MTLLEFPGCMYLDHDAGTPSQQGNSIERIYLLTTILDFVETPDPYVLLRVHTSPNRQQKTSVKSNTYDPVWNETFKFYLHERKKNTLGMSRYRRRMSSARDLK